MDRVMNGPRIMVFVKFFNNEEHAEQFLRGSLFMRQLRYFQSLEVKKGDDARPDRHEGVISWHQPQNIELTLNFPGWAPIVTPGSDLAGPLSITRDFYSDIYIFCLTAITLPDPASLRGDRSEVTAQLQALFQVDPQCSKFGPYAVLISAEEFLPRLRAAMEKLGYWSRANLVEYYDETTFHGDFDERDVPFRKQSGFKYQSEYRVCLQPPDISYESMTLELENLTGCAYKVSSADINSYLKVTSKS